jgi:hypothetical protein
VTSLNLEATWVLVLSQSPQFGGHSVKPRMRKAKGDLTMDGRRVKPGRPAVFLHLGKTCRYGCPQEFQVFAVEG